MKSYPEVEKISELITNSKKIVILQADNPDGDSLASSLALEQILHDLGKEPILYCGVNVPSYLHYLGGWDRVDKQIPNDFDLSIIVDCSNIGLFETLEKNNQLGALRTRPCIVIDHHDVESSIDFATVNCKHVAVSTGEMIFEIVLSLDWKLDKIACNRIATSILSDSLGLMSPSTTARSIHIIAELVERGVNLPELEEARRDLMRKSPELIKYKGELLRRIEFYDNNRIAIITIPWAEIEKYSQSYNPSMLVIEDMRLAEGTDIAIAFKLYEDGRITAKIRCNYGVNIANDLAKHFGGGGHDYASGFKIDSKAHKPLSDVKNECIEFTTELLNKNKASHDQTI